MHLWFAQFKYFIKMCIICKLNTLRVFSAIFILYLAQINVVICLRQWFFCLAQAPHRVSLLSWVLPIWFRQHLKVLFRQSGVRRNWNLICQISFCLTRYTIFNNIDIRLFTRFCLIICPFSMVFFCWRGLQIC